MDLKNQLQEAKKDEEDLVVLLKERIQDSKKLEKQIIQLRKGVDEKYIKSKFENSSRILDDILSNQIPSNTGLGYDKVKKPEYSSVIDQGGNERSYDALKSPVKREESKKYVSSFHDKDRTNEISKRPMTNRYQHIFLGHCYACNNFGHKSLICRSYEKFREYMKYSPSDKPKGRNHNRFTLLQRYDLECYKCNNHGHMERDCKLMTPTKKIVSSKFQDKKKVLEGKGRK